MISIKDRTTVSHGAVAAITAVLSVTATLATIKFVETSVAQPAPAAPGQLLTQPLSDLPGREVRMSILDRAPGNSSSRHRHPGHHTFGYVLEGTYEFAINGEPGRILKAGDTFYEPPTAIHTTSRNPSADSRTKILILMVADQNNPSTIPD